MNTAVLSTSLQDKIQLLDFAKNHLQEVQYEAPFAREEIRTLKIVIANLESEIANQMPSLTPVEYAELLAILINKDEAESIRMLGRLSL